MTKKKKIAIGIVSVILAGLLITTALLVILTSKFKVKNYNEMEYYNHTVATTIALGAEYDKPYSSAYYENGTQIIKNNNNKLGLFSNITGKIVVAPIYSDYTPLNSDSETNKSYFKFYNTDNEEDGFVIFDEKGNQVFKIGKESDEVYEYVRTIDIKTREVDVEDKYDVLNKTKSVLVDNIAFDRTYYKEGVYHYESWIITDKDNNTYTNLYTFEDGERKLVQTFGDNAGISIDDNVDFMQNIYFLENGKYVFITNEKKSSSSSTKQIIKVYNDELELKNTIEFNNALINSSLFRIGNYIFMQQLENATEDNYDFQFKGQNDEYYNINTYRINMKTGKMTDVKVDFVISELKSTSGSIKTSTFDVNKMIIVGYEIENKLVDNTKTFLVDKKLNTTEIDYTFNTITKISKNRFLASIDETSNFTLINKKFEVLADFSKYSNVFTTKDNIIASDNKFTYICNHDGLVIKKYNIGSIIDVNHEDYYLIKEVSTGDSETLTHYYKGNNGEKFELVLTETSLASGDRVNGVTVYYEVNTFIEEDYAYMLAYKIIGSTTIYDIYNFNGTKLISIELSSQYISPENIVYDDHIIICIGSTSILLDK